MEKEIFTIKENALSYDRGYVYSLQYHLVWCTKYRKQVLKNGIDAECKRMLYELWGGHLWNPSYCAVTVSDRSRDQVMAYIEGQKEKKKRK